MLEGLLTAVGTLCVVVLVIYLSYVFTRRLAKGAIGRSQSQYMRLCDQMGVGQDRSVAVIQVGDRYFLIGIAANQINILSELEEEGLIPLRGDEVSQSGNAPDFKEIMNMLGDKLNKKK